MARPLDKLKRDSYFDSSAHAYATHYAAHYCLCYVVRLRIPQHQAYYSYIIVVLVASLVVWKTTTIF